MELLLALLDADELVDVPPAELIAEVARPAGGPIYPVSLATETDEIGDSERPPFMPGAVAAAEEGPDEVALLAAGSPAELLAAVPLHLTASAEDQHDISPSRNGGRPLTRNLDRNPLERTARSWPAPDHNVSALALGVGSGLVTNVVPSEPASTRTWPYPPVTAPYEPRWKRRPAHPPNGLP